MAKDSFFQMPEEEAEVVLNALAKTMKATFGSLQIASEKIIAAMEGIGDAYDAWHLETLQKLVLLLQEQRRTKPLDTDL